LSVPLETLLKLRKALAPGSLSKFVIKLMFAGVAEGWVSEVMRETGRFAGGDVKSS